MGFGRIQTDNLMKGSTCQNSFHKDKAKIYWAVFARLEGGDAQQDNLLFAEGVSLKKCPAGWFECVRLGGVREPPLLSPRHPHNSWAQAQG